MKEQNHCSPSNYYAYSYDALNNVYLVRGVEPDYYYDEIIDHIPSDLIEKLVFEEYVRNDCVVDVKSSNLPISYSKNRCYAVVDFKGRYFTEEQVMDIVYGRLVKDEDIKVRRPVAFSSVETKKDQSFVKKLMHRFTR